MTPTKPIPRPMIPGLRILSLPQVAAATGYKPHRIRVYLRDDRIDGTPGRRFPEPLKPRGVGKREWRESSIIEWIDRLDPKVK